MKWFEPVSKAASKILKKYEDIKLNIEKQKRLSVYLKELLTPYGGKRWSSDGIHVMPEFPYGTDALYELSYGSDTLTIIHTSLRREIFRNGYDVLEADMTTEQVTTSEEEEEAGQVMSRKEILEILEDINENGQSIEDVQGEIEDDLNIMDDGFMLFFFEYIFNSKGEIVDKVFKQAKRGDPRYMGLVMNKYDEPGYDDEGNEILVSPVDRTEIILKPRDSNETVYDKHGYKCYRAHYFGMRGADKVYYFKDEVAFKSKFRPSKRRGKSPVMTLWQKTRTLLFMDKYMMEMYTQQRPPKAGLFFKTGNQEGLEKAWETAKLRANENPHHPVVMGVPNQDNGTGFVEFIDFMKSLDEMQYGETRKEMRQQMGALYGVEPVFQNDISTSGGLNNEGMQITVTNRAVEHAQNIHNYFLKKLAEAMGAKGWHIMLNPSEEQDEMAELERQRLTLENGSAALSLGLEAEYDEDSGKVIIKPGSLERSSFPFAGSPFDSSSPPSDSDATSGAPATPVTNKNVEKKARSGFTSISSILKNSINKIFSKLKDYKEEDLQQVANKINLELRTEMQDKTSEMFKRAYSKNADEVSKELGVNFVFDVVDENALVALASQRVLKEAYAGIADNLSQKVHEIIRKAYRTPKGLNVQEITAQIEEAAKVADHRAENIARTEMGKVSAAARKNSYAKAEGSENFLFKHIGPSDDRTTGVSKRIKERTSKGVSWEEYVKIVKEESAKDFPEWTVDKEFPVSHYQSRHTFVRVV